MIGVAYKVGLKCPNQSIIGTLGKKARCPNVQKSGKSEVQKTKSPDGQKSDCPEVRMSKCPDGLKFEGKKSKDQKSDGQKSRWRNVQKSEGQMNRSPASQRTLI